MREFEEKLQREKDDIRLRAEQEKRRIEQEKNLKEEEKAQLLDQLRKRGEE